MLFKLCFISASTNKTTEFTDISSENKPDILGKSLNYSSKNMSYGEYKMFKIFSSDVRNLAKCFKAMLRHETFEQCRYEAVCIKVKFQRPLVQNSVDWPNKYVPARPLWTRCSNMLLLLNLVPRNIAGNIQCTSIYPLRTVCGELQVYEYEICRIVARL
jgi:hypothetical protein